MRNFLRVSARVLMVVMPICMGTLAFIASWIDSSRVGTNWARRVIEALFFTLLWGIIWCAPIILWWKRTSPLDVD